MQENKEIEIRYAFIATPEFSRTFFDNAIETEVAYLMPPENSESTTSCRFRRRNGKATMTCKTSDGKNANSIERYEDEVEISNEAFEAYTEKLPIMKFFFYKDPLGREFKTFSDKLCLNPKMIVEKEFDHVPDLKEINEFANSLTEIGTDIYDMTDNFKFNVSNRYKIFRKIVSIEK